MFLNKLDSEEFIINEINNKGNLRKKITLDNLIMYNN